MDSAEPAWGQGGVWPHCEEVHEAGFTEFVEYNEAGEPDAVFYANMVALCIKEIQDLKAEVAALKGA